MKFFVCFGLLLSLGLGVCGRLAVVQPAPGYDALVQDGKAQLQAGSNDQALASAEQAIKLDAGRWEGYALAGGALINLKRYEEAADRFSKAIELAPQNKQDGLRELRRQCFAAESESAPAPSSPPASRASSPTPEATTTQAEIVLWKSIENSANPDDFQGYLKQYPDGAFAVLARNHLSELTVKKKTPAPGSEDATRRYIAEIEAGKPRYDLMGAVLADATRQQLPKLKKIIANLGAMKSVTFAGVASDGSDIYKVEFEHGSTEMHIIMGTDGKVDSFYFRPP